jgi:plasmid stabilization system protein ParE
VKRVSWTSQAYADLDAIYAYIARGNERYADVVSGKIVLAVLDL